MAQVRTFEEAGRLMNDLGLAPHDEHIVLNDGRVLTTPEEVRAWVDSLPAEPSGEGADGCVNA